MSTFQPLCKVWKVCFLAVLMNAESYRSVHGTDHWRAKLFIPTKNGKLASFILPFWWFCHILYKADGRGVLTEPLAYILVLLQLL